MIKYFYLFLIAFCFVSCTDKCEDGAVQYDIAKIKNSITTDDDEINFVDVYCKNNALTYVYEINSNEEWAKKLTEPSAKKEFNEIAMEELRKFYCNQSVVDFYAYKENYKTYC